MGVIGAVTQSRVVPCDGVARLQRASERAIKGEAAAEQGLVDDAKYYYRGAIADARSGLSSMNTLGLGETAAAADLRRAVQYLQTKVDNEYGYSTPDGSGVQFAFAAVAARMTLQSIEALYCY